MKDKFYIEKDIGIAYVIPLESQDFLRKGREVGWTKVGHEYLMRIPLGRGKKRRYKYIYTMEEYYRYFPHMRKRKEEGLPPEEDYTNIYRDPKDEFWQMTRKMPDGTKRVLYLRRGQKSAYDTDETLHVKEIYDSAGRAIPLSYAPIAMGFKRVAYKRLRTYDIKLYGDKITEEEFLLSSGAWSWYKWKKEKRKDGYIFTCQNPDGSNTILEVDESGYLQSPLLKSLIGETTRIITEKDAARFMRGMVHKKVWCMYKPSPDSELNRLVEIEFDGKGPPKINGEIYKKLLNKEDVRITDLVVRKGKLAGVGTLFESKLQTDLKYTGGKKVKVKEGRLVNVNWMGMKKPAVYLSKEKIDGEKKYKVKLLSGKMESREIYVDKVTEYVQPEKVKPLDREYLIYYDAKLGVYRLIPPKDKNMLVSLTDIEGISKDGTVDINAIKELRYRVGGLCLDNYTRDSLIKVQDDDKELRKAQEDMGVKAEEIMIGKISGMSKIKEDTGEKLTLAYHQKDACAYALNHDGRALLAHVPGSGKTITSIVTSMKMKQLKKVKKTLVLCPRGLADQWKNEIRNVTDEEPVVIGTKGTPGLDMSIKKFKKSKTKPFYTVVGYEYFLRHRDYFTKAGYDCIIADEGHRIRKGDDALDDRETNVHKNLSNSASETNKVLSQMNKKLKGFLVLTGSPFTTTIAVIPEYARMITKGKINLGTSKEYADEHLDKDPITKQHGLVKDPSEVGKQLSDFSHFVTQKDIKGKTMPFGRLDTSIQGCTADKYLTVKYKKARGELSKEGEVILKQLVESGESIGVLSEEDQSSVMRAREILCCPTAIISKEHSYLSNIDVIPELDKESPVSKSPVMLPRKFPYRFPKKVEGPPRKSLDYHLWKNRFFDMFKGKLEKSFGKKLTSYDDIAGLECPDSLIGKATKKSGELINPKYKPAHVIYKNQSFYFDDETYAWYKDYNVETGEFSNLVKTKTDEKSLNNALLSHNIKARKLTNKINGITMTKEGKDDKFVVFANRIGIGIEPIESAMKEQGHLNIADAMKSGNVSLNGNYYALYRGKQKDAELQDYAWRKDPKTGKSQLITLVETKNNKEIINAIKKYWGSDMLTKKGDRYIIKDKYKHMLNNINTMVASDAAQLGKNWGHANHIIEWDIIAAPQLEKQRRHRVIRLRPEEKKARVKEIIQEVKGIMSKLRKKGTLPGREGEIITDQDFMNAAIDKLPEDRKEELRALGHLKSISVLTVGVPEDPTDPNTAVINDIEQSQLQVSKVREKGMEDVIEAARSVQAGMLQDKEYPEVSMDDITLFQFFKKAIKYISDFIKSDKRPALVIDLGEKL